MPKFSAYMKGGEGTAGPPGASIIDGILAEESMLPVPNSQNKHAYLVGTSDPKTLWVWDDTLPGGMEVNKWVSQGRTASKIAEITASITTIPWSTTAIPSIETHFSTSNQEDYFNFDFKIPESQPAGFGKISITTKKISYTSEPNASVTSSGENWAKNFNFSFGIPEGKPAGFSTNQSTTVSTLQWDEPATVKIIPNDATPNDSKSFNFKFGVPQGRAAGFGVVSATVSTTNWNNESIVQVTTSGENYAKNIDFDFILPAGRPAGFGVINVTTSTLPSGTEPWVKINSITNSPEYEKDFNFEFGLPVGIAAGFSTGQHVSVSTLEAGEQAVVKITTVPESPETAKEFNFHFGLPRGDALAIYDGITFTSTEDGIDYHWDTTNTTTLIFNRGTIKKVPIYIYNSNNESIASTFKLTNTTIEYEVDEKFDGIIYLMMPATLQSVEIGNVSSTSYINPPAVSMSTGSTSTKIILDFVIPEGTPPAIIDSITTDIQSLSTNLNSATTNIQSLSTTINSVSTTVNNLSTVIAKKALHISMPSTTTFQLLEDNNITTTMRVVNIVWGTPSNVASNVSWNTDTVGQLVLSGTLAGPTTAEIDLIDFG